MQKQKGNSQHTSHQITATQLQWLKMIIDRRAVRRMREGRRTLPACAAPSQTDTAKHYFTCLLKVSLLEFESAPTDLMLQFTVMCVMEGFLEKLVSKSAV